MRYNFFIKQGSFIVQQTNNVFLLASILILNFSCSSILPIQKKDEITLLAKNSQKNMVIKESDSGQLEEAQDTEEISSEIISTITIPQEESGKDPIQSLNEKTRKETQKWIDYFANKDRERFQRFLDRGAKYKSVVQTILQENDLPANLYYLALIESGYVTHAKSHAKAVGVWQFIGGTAKRYGLNYNQWVDDRLDPIKSTIAAAKYLEDLHNVFLSWELAMAAYNCGENRVLRAIMKGKTRDFWKLVEKKLLPPETRNYVPKFLAAAIIGENMEKFKFKQVSNLEEYPSVISVEVPTPTLLEDVASKTAIPLTTLKELNLQLRKGVTPPYGDIYELWIPKEFEKQFQTNVSHIKKASGKQYASTPAEVDTETTIYHRVNRGETLVKISQQYGISIRELKNINNLKNSTVRAGQRLKIGEESYTSAKQSSVHIVAKGDTLSSISQQYNISLSYLKKINHIAKNRIYVGQQLKIKAKSYDKNTQNHSRVHKVQRGETLSSISKKYNITIPHLTRLNNLKNNRINVGQRLIIKY